MIKLTEGQLFDYMTCPALFDMKYVKGLAMSSQKKTLSSLLSKVSDYFYFHLLNGKVLSLADMKKKWDNICEENGLTQKQALEGMHMIAKFANWMGREQPIVLDIKTPYTIKVGDVELSGTMSPIFKLGKSEEFVITDFGSKTPDQQLIDMKAKYTIDTFAYRELFGKEISGVRIHNIKYDKEFKTLRSEAQFDRLKSTIKGIGEGIKNRSFYTRESFTCSNCPAINYCNFWTNDI